MKETINPHLLKPGYRKNKFNDGTKVYLLLVAAGNNAILTRRKFKRASEAMDYSIRVWKRWLRLYDAAVVVSSQNVPQPVPAE